MHPCGVASGRDRERKPVFGRIEAHRRGMCLAASPSTQAVGGPLGILRGPTTAGGEGPMPLDDREQRILEEIERQFYEEDPKLAETVRSATLASLSGKHLKWASLGLVVGVGLMLGFFTRNTIVALLGFGLMVVSVVGLVAVARGRAGVAASPEKGLLGGLRRRWRSR